MPDISRIIGGAGTGKTTELIRLMLANIDRGYRPNQIGFVSFTRAARREAAERAALQIGCEIEELEQGGWFRTLHSICYRQLSIGKELLSGNKDDTAWLVESLNCEVSAPSGEADDGTLGKYQGKTDADVALQLWSCSRSKLVPLHDVWDRAQQCDARTPAYQSCERLVERYEQAKRLDGRVDFVDILGKFAGYEFKVAGPREVMTDGDVPNVPIWFLDEQQDTSALLDAVCHRLIEPSELVYVVGDPFQSIYGWAGASPSHFMGWDVNRSKILPQTFRCPAPIHKLGESILKRSSDFFDRAIRPASHAGRIDEVSWAGDWLSEVDPRESWLLVARTNFQAQRLIKRLRGNNIPWLSTRADGGGSPWHAPVRNKAIKGAKELHSGGVITGDEWVAMLKQLPTKKELVVRGTKAKWAKIDDAAKQLVDLSGLADWGATDNLINALKTNAWRSLLPGGSDYVEAEKRFGWEAITNPGVRVGTVHSVKGSEADNVLLLTTTSEQIANGEFDDEGHDEERRVEYVAVTRARKRLILCHDRKPNYRMEI